MLWVPLSFWAAFPRIRNYLVDWRREEGARLSLRQDLPIGLPRILKSPSQEGGSAGEGNCKFLFPSATYLRFPTQQDAKKLFPVLQIPFFFSTGAPCCHRLKGRNIAVATKRTRKAWKEKRWMEFSLLSNFGSSPLRKKTFHYAIYGEDFNFNASVGGRGEGRAASVSGTTSKVEWIRKRGGQHRFFFSAVEKWKRSPNDFLMSRQWKEAGKGWLVGWLQLIHRLLLLLFSWPFCIRFLPSWLEQGRDSPIRLMVHSLFRSFV